MGNIVGMGIIMGKIELDDRGRLTIPASIREKLNLKPGDKLSIEIDNGNVLKIKKTPTKEEIFQNLVGCINIPQMKQPSIQEIKGIWKTNP
ncbi:MAG: AbrB/MazE/SpoVT family DNA-binding domain-containing protein [Promethearchaeota archaeon]